MLRTTGAVNQPSKPALIRHIEQNYQRYLDSLSPEQRAEELERCRRIANETLITTSTGNEIS